MTTQLYITGFLQSIGLIAITALAFERVLRGTHAPTRRTIATGIVLSLGAIGTMSVPIQVAPGILFDLRYVLVILSAPLGGPVASIIVMIAGGAYRIGLGGVGATAGAFGIVIAALAGLYLSRILRIKPTSPARVLVYGLSASLSILSVFVLPWGTAISVLESIGPVLLIGNLVGVFVASYLIGKPRDVLSRERTLSEMARTDPLTGVSNRRHFEEMAPRFINRTAAAGRHCALIMVDIDHFKSINDTLGHDAGDTILRAVARTLRSTSREGDLVSRHGGEEFALLAQVRDAAGAEAAAQRLRSAVENMTHTVRGLPIRVTISVGYQVIGKNGPDLDTAFLACDAALYRAKAGGRNRVEMAIAA